VRRWHIVTVAREQTVAEHQYRVWLFTRESLKILEIPLLSELGLRTQFRSLEHDQAEVVLGDIPTPSKAFLNEVFGADVVGSAEIQIIGGISSDDKKFAGAIIKCADLLESVDWLRIVKLGDHAESVFSDLKSTLLNQLVALSDLFELKTSQVQELKVLYDAHTGAGE